MTSAFGEMFGELAFPVLLDLHGEAVEYYVNGNLGGAVKTDGSALIDRSGVGFEAVEGGLAEVGEVEICLSLDVCGDNPGDGDTVVFDGATWSVVRATILSEQGIARLRVRAVNVGRRSRPGRIVRR
jgi:hypothetical protein